MRTLQRALLAIGLWVLCGSGAWAQTSSGGDVFAGQDPLEVRAQVMPAPSSGGCTPPGNLNWKLVARQGGACYYVAPLPTRLNGYVADINDVGAVERLGGRCGVDEFDNTKAVCFNKGDDQPGAAPTKGLPSGIGRTPPPDQPGENNNNQRPTGGGPGNNRGGPGPNYIPRIPGPAGGIGYVPGADPCLPKGPGGYNYCDNPRGTRLPPGCYCGGPPPAPKTLRREPEPEQPAQIKLNPPAPPPVPLNVRVVYQKMNDCLRARLPYMVILLPQAPYMLAARKVAAASVSPSKPFEQVPFRSQLFLLETAAALQAQAYHDSLYGRSRRVADPTDDKDYLVGWLDHCLANNGLAPTLADAPAQDPRTDYAQFLNVSGADSRALWVFGRGYGEEAIPPLPLLPNRPVR